jgi:hypothetical protein
MKGKGLIAALKVAPVPAKKSPAEDDLAGEAFDALKGGDREGFVSAFKEAVRACMDSYGSDEGADEEE